ncbi:MAG: TRAP transporter large permease subunit [Planctomycetes bacterium]|nr:TRAP transporter large permease subunit [Planctomycetota bacterium]
MSWIIVLALTLAGVPLFAVMALSAIFAQAPQGGDLQGIVISFYQIAETPLLTTLPLFAFAGYLLADSAAPRRLLRVSNAFLGWLPGGLSVVAIWTCAVVTAMTGASGVTIVAAGGLLVPALVAHGYSEKFALGIVTAGGTVGLVFPPGLPVILYGVVSEAPIEDLFRGGALPGVLVLAALSGYALFRSYRLGMRGDRFSIAEIGGALREAIWEVPLPFLVIGGIYTGMISVSEAAVVAALYVTVVEIAIYREVKISRVPSIARECAVTVGGVLIILGMTLAVTSYVIDAELPQRLFEQVRDLMTSKAAFLLALNLFLLGLGCVLDIFSAIILIVPMLLPLAERYEVDPIHLGVVFLINMAIGYATPPVGLNLFIASVRFDKPVLMLYRAALPFCAVMVLALFAITYAPQLTLCWLTR